jgi:hypothetical protein
VAGRRSQFSRSKQPALKSLCDAFVGGGISVGGASGVLGRPRSLLNLVASAAVDGRLSEQNLRTREDNNRVQRCP